MDTGDLSHTDARPDYQLPPPSERVRVSRECYVDAGPPGAIGSRDVAPRRSMPTSGYPPELSYVADQNVFQVVLGNTQTGISIAYPSCQHESFHICAMQFFSMGASPDCCVFYVLPHPLVPSGEYEFSDC